MSEKIDYSGCVGIVHYSDYSIADPNCLCFATDYKDKDIIDKNVIYNNSLTGDVNFKFLKFGSIFSNRSRIIHCDKDFSGMMRTQFCFTSCNNLQKMYVGEAGYDDDNDDDDYYKLPTEWDKQSYSSFTGTFDELMYSHCTFRNNIKLTNIEFKFPKLIYSFGDFYNNTKLTTVTTNLGNLVIGLNAFDCCKQLTTITSVDKFNCLINGVGMFSNCTSLKNFDYELPSLLFGADMFKNCKLNAKSVTKILNSLPDINDCDNEDASIANEKLKTNILGNGMWTKITENKVDCYSRNGTNFGIVYNLVRQTQKNGGYDRFLIYYKLPRYSYSSNDYETVWNPHPVNTKDFGKLDLGIDDNVENNSDVCDALNKAIANGWNISFNKTTKKYTYYKSGSIRINKRAVIGGNTRVYQGTYIVKGERAKGKSGKLSILITPLEDYKVKYENEVVIEPTNSSNDDGSFKQVKLISINRYEDISTIIFGDINAKYSDFKLSLIPDGYGDFRINL